MAPEFLKEPKIRASKENIDNNNLEHKIKHLSDLRKQAKTFTAQDREIRKAIKINNLEKFNNLINMVDLDKQDAAGFTLLHDAILFDRPLIIKALLNKNVNAKLKDFTERTALNLAREKRNQEIISLLEEYLSKRSPQ